jgi:hypothetical protein
MTNVLALQDLPDESPRPAPRTGAGYPWSVYSIPNDSTTRHCDD